MVNNMRRVLLAIATMLFSIPVHAEWPRELFKKAYDQINGSTQKGSYFVTGESTQSGTFVAELKMPNSVVWRLVDDEDKKNAQVFSWSKEKGIIEFPIKNNKTQDKRMDLWTSSTGKLAILGLLSSLHDWREPTSLSAKTVTMMVKYEEPNHLLSVQPQLPLLRDYEWIWKIKEKPMFKVSNWLLKSGMNEYLFVFLDQENGVKK
jgi:hypothetical protein